MSELLSNLCVARNDATGVVSINGEGRGLFPFDENSSLRWKITKIQECLVQVIFKNLGFCLAKLLFRWIDFLHKFFFESQSVSQGVNGTLWVQTSTSHKGRCLEPEFIKEIILRKCSLKRLYGELKKKKLRNGTLDCLGNEANFHTCFRFSFFFPVLFLCVEPVRVFDVWRILTIEPMLLNEIFQQVFNEHENNWTT